MAEEVAEREEPQLPPEPSIPAKGPNSESENDATQQKQAAPSPAAPPDEKPVDDSKALAVQDKSIHGTERKTAEGASDRDAVLARVETEKRLSLIKAWEENEKCKANNKADKKLSSIAAWENSKKASIEAKMKKIEENLEKKKAEYMEKMKNNVALVHKSAEEKKVNIEFQREQDLLDVLEMASKYRAKGAVPKKMFGCL